MRPWSMEDSSLVSVINGRVTAGVRMPVFSAMYIWVRSSAAEPLAMWRYCINSFCEFRSAPSAIFDGIETAARFIWSLSPNSLESFKAT